MDSLPGALLLNHHLCMTKCTNQNQQSCTRVISHTSEYILHQFQLGFADASRGSLRYNTIVYVKYNEPIKVLKVANL